MPALLRYRGAAPEVWLYRGAWQEWSVTEADVLVPLSQEELRNKVFAIFKHQSQKDVAPFPGGYDDREFWQRVRSRNLETAAAADRPSSILRTATICCASPPFAWYPPRPSPTTWTWTPPPAAR